MLHRAIRTRPFPRSRCALAWALCAGAAAAPASAQLTVGPNVNISRQGGNQAEASIAINPTNPQNLFVLYNNLSSGNPMFGAVSTNGGLTWTSRPVGTGSDGISASIGDPTVAFDNFGNLFLAHLTSSGFNTQICLSVNGGVSFTTLTSITGSTDQPTIIAGGGAVWVCTSQSGVVARGASVTGLGLVGGFVATQLAPTSGAVNGDFGDIAIGPAGQVAIVYQNANSGQGPDNIYFNLDADGIGAGAFGARSTITATNVGGFDFIPAQNSRSIDAEAGLAYDRTGGAHNGRLYLIYTDEVGNESNNTDIMFRFSDNNGSSWSPAVRINDDATTRSQFLPKIALDPATGHLAAIWYDTRSDPGNTQAEVWGTASLDGGATWLPNIRISQGRSLAGADPNFDFGDYTGLTIYNDVFYPVWADSSNSTGDNPNGTTAMDIYTARVTIGAAPCYANCDGSTIPPILNVNDFNCFVNRYAAGCP